MAQIHSLFKDPTLEERFRRDGYVVIDFISAEQAKWIAQKFYDLHPSLPTGFYSAAFNSNDSFKEDIYNHTNVIFQEVVENTFKDFKILGSTFLCKSPGDAGKVGVHQDWSVVDEKKFYSATIWVPTLDTTENNGALRVLPGSHRFFDAYRSNNIPLSYKGSEQLLWDAMITVPMKAGQAFILNHAVIHASSANTTNTERLAIAYGIVHKDANLYYYHKEPTETGDSIEVYEMPDDFFQRYYNIGFRPQFGNMIKIMDYAVKVASIQEIENKIRDLQIENLLPYITRDNKLPEKLGNNFFSKLKRIFS